MLPRKWIKRSNAKLRQVVLRAIAEALDNDLGELVHTRREQCAKAWKLRYFVHFSAMRLTEVRRLEVERCRWESYGFEISDSLTVLLIWSTDNMSPIPLILLILLTFTCAMLLVSEGFPDLLPK